MKGGRIRRPLPGPARQQLPARHLHPGAAEGQQHLNRVARARGAAEGLAAVHDEDHGPTTPGSMNRIFAG